MKPGTIFKNENKQMFLYLSDKYVMDTVNVYRLPNYELVDPIDLLDGICAWDLNSLRVELKKAMIVEDIKFYKSELNKLKKQQNRIFNVIVDKYKELEEL